MSTVEEMVLMTISNNVNHKFFRLATQGWRCEPQLEQAQLSTLCSVQKADVLPHNVCFNKN